MIDINFWTILTIVFTVILVILYVADFILKRYIAKRSKKNADDINNDLSGKE